VADRQLSAEEKLRVCDVLLRILAVRDQNLRNLYVTELEAQLGQQLGAPRHSDPRHDLFSVLTACTTIPGALRAFISIVRGFHPENTAFADLDKLLADGQIPPGLSLVRQEQLTGLLAEAASDQVSAAYHDVVEDRSTGAPPDWRDAWAVLRRLEAVDNSGPVPLSLVFADRLAHRLADRPTALGLHRWIDEAGGERGLDQATIRGLCLDSRRLLGQDETGVVPDFRSDPTGDPASDVRPELSETSGDLVPTLAHPRTVDDQADSLRLIRGGVPIRNPHFTGRDSMIERLRKALLAGSKASVLPQALHGLGGVGKTQLAIEYSYRFADQYDLIWWISAEQPTAVRATLAQLGDRLGLPPSQDIQQTAATVLNALSSSSMRWLLVYDNADKPDDLLADEAPLIPSANGHVILTSRNQDWLTLYQAIEVDVFERSESVELLTRRAVGITPDDANRLAEKLGDLPLALEQAATWHAATGMSVSEYLRLFDKHVQDLMAEGKPPSAPATVAAFVNVASERLRTRMPAAAQLLELFAFFGPEPIPAWLLKSTPDISSPLREALADEIVKGRTIRELGRCGLAKVDPNAQRIQVHRLVQLVLREGLPEDLREQSLDNVRSLLAAANPGYPDEAGNWRAHAAIAPHLAPADLIGAPTVEARKVVLDQIRYLYQTGDYDGSRALGELAINTWSAEPDKGGLGPDDAQTLLASRYLANALRQLGHYRSARELDETTLERLRSSPDFGEDHPHTLSVANNVGVDLRLAGLFRQALELDRENLARCRRVFGEEDQITLRAKNSVAVSLRMLGDFRQAQTIDQEVASQWQQTLGDNDSRTLFSISNLARDYYGLGRYAEALDMQRRVLPLHRELLGPLHNEVLLAARTIAIALRKTGQYPESVSRAQENYHAYDARFGADHEHTLAAKMSYANALRLVGELVAARALASEAVDAYKRNFGERHALTLAACTNLGVIMRAQGGWREARALDESTLSIMREVLGEEHPYTLCAANNYTNNLVLDREFAKAHEMSRQTLTVSRKVRGDTHPYTLACAINAASDMQEVGDEAGEELRRTTIAAFARILGPEHPETLDADRGKRAECDIEPPPT
jgi:tetratricopeptide (TPR) repeat protein